MQRPAGWGLWQGELKRGFREKGGHYIVPLTAAILYPERLSCFPTTVLAVAALVVWLSAFIMRPWAPPEQLHLPVCASKPVVLHGAPLPCPQALSALVVLQLKHNQLTSLNPLTVTTCPHSPGPWRQYFSPRARHHQHHHHHHQQHRQQQQGDQLPSPPSLQGQSPSAGRTRGSAGGPCPWCCGSRLLVLDASFNCIKQMDRGTRWVAGWLFG